MENAQEDLERAHNSNHELHEENCRLVAANERLLADNALLEQRAADRLHQLHDRMRDQQTLERVIELLKAERTTYKVRLYFQIRI